MMHYFDVYSRRYARFESLRHAAGLVHAFSTRPDDVSARRDERQAERAARRRQMAADLGFDAERLCYCVQVHETRLAVIDRVAAGGPLEGVDAVVTALPGVPLMTFSADCPLILAYDPRRRVVGVAHASWRCTVALTTQRLIQIMQQKWECEPGDIMAGIGPSAGPCCYEVQQDVFDAAADLPDRAAAFQFREVAVQSDVTRRMFFDLWTANEQLLVSAGLRRENIEQSGICTMCGIDAHTGKRIGGGGPPPFYSFRREKAGCGHFGLMAGLA